MPMIRRFLLACLLWLVCVPAWAAVAIDACSAVTTTAGALSLSSTGLTVANVANRVLVTTFVTADQSIAGLTLTWDSGGTNQAMTQIAVANTLGVTGRAYLFGLVNPVSGNKTLKAAWNVSASAAMSQCSWTGVNQTGGATSFPHSASATGTTDGTCGTSNPAVTVTSATGNAVMAVHGYDDAAAGACSFGSVNASLSHQYA